jgi:hypothetical protein
MSENGPAWVYVDQPAALGHPKGNLGVALYGVALWLALTAAFETSLIWAGAPTWWAAFGLLGLFAAFGIVTRVPWSLVLTILLAARQIVGFFRDVEAGLPFVFLIQACIAFLVVFYLLEGDRPNLIYRHRYRKYSAEGA